MCVAALRPRLSCVPHQSESRLVQQKELVELQEELMKEKGKDVEDMQHKLLEAARQLDREVWSAFSALPVTTK